MPFLQTRVKPRYVVHTEILPGFAESGYAGGGIFYPILVFAVFSALFILLRSKDPLGVDGAFRCFAVFRTPQLSFAENNHALYPANVFIWTRLAKLVGFDIGSVQNFYSTVELMNCVAAAGCLALFFRLSLMATLSKRAALGITLGLGLSRAFLLHATNASEPMVAIFWSFLAIYLAARCFRTVSRWPAFVSGVLVALAMASYQTAVLLGPVAVLILWRAAQPRSSSRTIAPKLLNVFSFTAGAFTGCMLIYGCIVRFRLHASAPGTAVGSVLSGLFHDPGSIAYLGIRSGRLLNLPLGFLRNSYPVLTQFAGIREFLRGAPLSVIFIFFLLAGFAVLAAYCAIRMTALWKILEPRTRTGILCGVVGVPFTIVPLLIWDPQYDKFWIQPLACLIFLLGISLHVISSRPWIFSRGIALLLFFGLLFNFGWLVHFHRTSIVEMREAQRLSTLVRRGDLVVGNWDGISVLYHYAWLPPGTKFISFPSDAIRQGPQSLVRLQQSISATLASGGRALFVSLLDEPKSTWDSFLTLRCGVPYSSFDVYRAHSVPYATFETRYGRVAVKRLELSVPSEVR